MPKRLASENADKRRFSTSNGHGTINPTRVSTNQCFSASNAPEEKSGSLLADESPESNTDHDGYSHFRDLLLSWDFTPTQMILISDAMKESGLNFR